MARSVAVIGSGPGGLTAAMILAREGYRVDVFEKQPEVGGRNSHLQLGDYRFDLGPTFLMMNFIFEEVFALAGRDVHQYLDIREVDPLYRLVFGPGREFRPTRDPQRMTRELERAFPGSSPGYQRFLAAERKKFARIVPCLQVPYDSWLDYLRPRFLRALPVLDAGHSLYDHLGRYFVPDDLKTAFTFQAKYLGMSPWSCPATFSIISYIEHSGGVHHPIGGLNQITKAMAKVLGEHGGRLHLNSGVRSVRVKGDRATGLVLASGEEIESDYVVVGADFGHAVEHLLPRSSLRRYTPEKLEKKGISCSTFMLYLGLDTIYRDLPHHNVFFAEDYKRNVGQIADSLTISEDPSFYVQNACVLDPSLAPPGHSTLYVLVPCPNTRSGIDWRHVADFYRDKVLDRLEQQEGLTDLRRHIVAERQITPTQWETEHDVYRGAVFNLAHTIGQMLSRRPHNEFEELRNCYLAGGGTHPGSGLPTIVESGRISAGMILGRG